MNCIHVNSNLSLKDGHKWAYPCQRSGTSTVFSGAPRAREARTWAEPHSLVNLPIPENLVIT